MKTRRVGSITCGGLLILFGVLFIVRMILPVLSYDLIFRLWPLILIALGVEMLLVNVKRHEGCEIKYDLGAIALVIILAFFSMGMGIMEYCIKHFPNYYF